MQIEFELPNKTEHSKITLYKNLIENMFSNHLHLVHSTRMVKDFFIGKNHPFEE